MSRMFNKGSERMSAKEICLVHGEDEIIEVTAKEYADYERLLGLDHTSFKIDDLDIYDIIQEENGVIWHMIVGKTKEGVLIAKNMVSDVEFYIHEGFVTEGMKATKHYEVLRLAKPLNRDVEF